MVDGDSLPSDWDVRRIAWLGRIVGGGTPSKSEPDFWDGSIPWVSPKDMKRREIINSEDHITRRGVRESSTQVVPSGTVLVVTRSGILSHSLPVAIAYRPVAINQDLKGLILGDDVASGYLAYWLEAHASMLLSIWRKAGTTVESLDTSLIKQTSVPLPPLPTQRAIASFLDRETEKIDTLIEKKRRLLDLLEEKRTALITRVVTRGLDRDVPMKDSGVAWLGEIPDHWEVVKLRYVARRLQTGPFGAQLGSGDYVEGGVPVINPANLKNGGLQSDHDKTVTEGVADRLSRYRLMGGDLVFARRGELGRCGLVTDEEGWLCGTGCVLLRPDPRRLEPRYLLFYSHLIGVADWLSEESVGSTMENLNTSMLGRLPLLLPSANEQRQITTWTTERLTELGKVEDRIIHAIPLLQEYRTSLISHAVTGKIESRAIGDRSG